MNDCFSRSVDEHGRALWAGTIGCWEKMEMLAVSLVGNSPASDPGSPGTPFCPAFPGTPLVPDLPGFPGGPCAPGAPCSPLAPFWPDCPRFPAAPGRPFGPGAPGIPFVPCNLLFLANQIKDLPLSQVGLVSPGHPAFLAVRLHPAVLGAPACRCHLFCQEAQVCPRDQACLRCQQGRAVREGRKCVKS